MSMVKKILIGITAIVIIGAAGAMLKVKMDHSGETYYTCIVNEGLKVSSKLSEESKESNINEYEYNEPAFDKEGNRKDITFMSYRERALKKGAYLSVVYNERNGVIGYSEISADDIPEKAMEGLKKYVE